MAREIPTTLLLDDVAGGCCVFVVGAVGGSVFYFVKGALRSSSKGCRLAGGVQPVVTNRPRVRRCAAWSAVFVTINSCLMDTRDVEDPLSMALAAGAANTLFFMRRGTGAAVRSGLKGAAYGGLAWIAVTGIIRFVESALEISD